MSLRAPRSLLAASLAAAAAAACGGGERPRGPDLQVTGETTKLRLGDPLPDASPFFDGETVRLRAARGETLAVVVWRRPGEPVPVALSVDGAAVEGFAVAHHRVRRRSTRMYGPSAGAGWWPDRLVSAGGAAVPAERVAWFDVAVPPDAAPGIRAGTLAVGDRAFPVELRVEAVALPPLDDAPRAWAYHDAREIARASGTEVGSAGGRAAELAWSAMLRAHGVAGSPDLWLDDWAWRREQVRGLPWVPVKLTTDPEEAATTARAWARTLAPTGQVPFAIPIDEPRRLWRKVTVRALAAEVRRATADAGPFLFAVTDEPHFVYGDAIDVYLSPFAVALDAPAEVGGRPAHRWTYNGTPPLAGAMILDTDGAAPRTWGWIGWRWRVPLWYVWDAAYWSDRHNHRRRGGGRGLAPTSSIDDDAVTFDDGDDRGNLDGVLGFWADGPAPSWRLKAIRRGLQDRALLELHEACAGRDAAGAIAAELVPVALGDAGRLGDSRPGAWPTDEPAWEAARARLLDALAACPPSPR